MNEGLDNLRSSRGIDGAIDASAVRDGHQHRHQIRADFGIDAVRGPERPRHLEARRHNVDRDYLSWRVFEQFQSHDRRQAHRPDSHHGDGHVVGRIDHIEHC